MAQSFILEEPSMPGHSFSLDKQEAYSNFLVESCSRNHIKTLCIVIPISNDDPLRWFSHHRSNYSSQFYWEIPTQPIAIAALGAIKKVTASGTERFNTIENTLRTTDSEILTFNFSEKKKDFFPHWIGGFSFYPELDSPIWNNFPAASFTLPELSINREKGKSIGCLSIPVNENATPDDLHYEIAKRMLLFSPENFHNGKPAGSGTARKHNFINPDTNREEEFQQWEQAIDEAKKQFEAKKLEKVVLTRMSQLPLRKPCNPIQTLSQLRQQYPKGCSFLIKNEHSPGFLGCSPEKLLSVRGSSIETEALAGSIARGETDSEDSELAKKLLASSKDQKEHDFVVQSIRRNLSPFLKECYIPQKAEIKKLPNVQHLYTPFEGVMKEDATILQLLENLHPTPAVGGTPRSPALSFIQDMEPFERGWFAAPIGWITTSGAADFYVAIRSGLVDEEKALLFAGCGIVADSDAKAEWEEANLKFKPMLSLLNNE